MSRISFEAFGELGAGDQPDTVKAGRYAFQEESEARIVDDVVAKLKLRPTDDLLEIGCGTGNLLIPLAEHVHSVTGIDHENLVTALYRRFDKVRLHAGNFLDLEVWETFDKILVYSVLHYLSDEDEVRTFIDKALGLLRPDGRMLLGDIPNADLRRRFEESDEGRRFNAEWAEKVKGKAAGIADPERVEFDDGLVITLLASLRLKGFDAFLLPQEGYLSFGHTREDILVVKR